VPSNLIHDTLLVDVPMPVEMDGLQCPRLHCCKGLMGGMQVLKYLPVKISEYLHNEHGDKFSSLGLPPSDSCRGLTLLEIDQLFERIEFVGADSTVIVAVWRSHDWELRI
jgi:hypothetical protein